MQKYTFMCFFYGFVNFQLCQQELVWYDDCRSQSQFNVEIEIGSEK